MIRSISILLLFFMTTMEATTGAERPNVILMMADDLGYNDLSCYGGKIMPTPHLDQMAREGIRLTSFYAGCTVCTPSRMALLTGAYPKRLGWGGGVGGYKIKWENGLSTKALTLAEIFKEAGYATGMCGKWHLGDGEGMIPTQQGFDTAFYIKASNNQTTELWRDEKLIADPFNNRLLSEQFTDESIDFIRKNKAKPFFLYLPFTAPHFPAEAHPDWKGKSKNFAYGDVVEELDSRVGQIFYALKSEGLDKNTIVVFLSDNGPEGGQKKWASAKPYRGLKWTSLEGGNRVPCMVRWPGVIPNKQESDKMVAAIDLLPTLVHACGIDFEPSEQTSPKIDGLNVWNTFIGKDGQHPRTHLLYWDGWAKLDAIRMGEWKLYLKEVKYIPQSKEGPVLINLKKDVAEETNLADKHTQKVSEMTALAEKLSSEIEENSMPLGGLE